jgi:hypothetical protein
MQQNAFALLTISGVVNWCSEASRMGNIDTQQVIFEAVNHHPPSASIPPHFITNVPGRYYGYFENEHKEQFLFVYDRETKSGALWLGDNNWETPTKVIKGDVPELTLSRTERMWLLACWLAATEFEQKPDAQG